MNVKFWYTKATMVLGENFLKIRDILLLSKHNGIKEHMIYF